MPSGSLRSAQTWSQGHLRSLASDANAAALNDDSAESKLDIEEGGVSPWKGDKVSLQTVNSSQCSCQWNHNVARSAAPNGIPLLQLNCTPIAAPTVFMLKVAPTGFPL